MTITKTSGANVRSSHGSVPFSLPPGGAAWARVTAAGYWIVEGSGLCASAADLAALAASVANVGIHLLSPQATTSGTFKDFAIPAGAKRVTIMFDGVRKDSASDLLVQIGPSGGVETTSYTAESSYGGSVNSYVNGTTYTTGFGITVPAAGDIVNGHMVLEKSKDHVWLSSHALGRSDAPYWVGGGGRKALAGELAIVRITSVSGTANLNLGEANVSWQA